MESATYGSESTALRIARDLLIALRLKLMSFGIPIDGPCNVFMDNEAVFKNASIPESRLTKKHNSINFHINREAVAAGIMRVAYEPTATNRADALTKNVAFEVKRKHLHDLLEKETNPGGKGYE